MIFKNPSDKEFSEVCTLIKAYELDNRHLRKEEFTIALNNNQIIAFGRLRKHSDCAELCSIGVLKTDRNKGMGSALVKHIIQNSTLPIYVVCIIPEFFTRFGFKLTTNYPQSIAEKINYCTHELSVPQAYVAMVLEKV
jgi:amino-acid N-acetyltransferase